MIRISGQDIVNRPENYEDNELLRGEVNSQALNFLKTPLYVYGLSINQILEFAAEIKHIDSAYDIVHIFDVPNDRGEREYLKTKRI